MLVVGHQDHGVAGGLQLVEHARVLTEQGGDPDLAAEGIKRLVGLADQLRIDLHGLGREILEVEDIARVAARLGVAHQVLDEGVARRGIEQQGVGQGPVPIAVVRIVDHRQDRRLVRGLGQQGLGLGIVRHAERAQRPFRGDPLRSEHVELVDVCGQGHAGTLVPRCVEADGQRFGRPA